MKSTGELKGVKWEGDVKQTAVWLCFFVMGDKTLSEEDCVAFLQCAVFCHFPHFDLGLFADSQQNGYNQANNLSSRANQGNTQPIISMFRILRPLLTSPPPADCPFRQRVRHSLCNTLAQLPVYVGRTTWRGRLLKCLPLDGRTRCCSLTV